MTKELNPDNANGVGTGQWVQFVEVTAVYWDKRLGAEPCFAGNTGLFSIEGDNVMYESYRAKIVYPADFAGQVEVFDQ